MVMDRSVGPEYSEPPPVAQGICRRVRNRVRADSPTLFAVHLLLAFGLRHGRLQRGAAPLVFRFAWLPNGVGSLLLSLAQSLLLRADPPSLASSPSNLGHPH